MAILSVIFFIAVGVMTIVTLVTVNARAKRNSGDSI
jgi:hypothetical protein